MARLLPISHLLMQQKLGSLPASLASFLTLTAIFSVFSLVIFLCGAHRGMMDSVTGKTEKTKTVRLGGENKKGVKEKVRSGLSSGALSMSKMISWRKVDSADVGRDDDGVFEEDGAVWEKTIIKGEKCRPLDFSGQILYDADGKLLPD